MGGKIAKTLIALQFLSTAPVPICRAQMTPLASRRLSYVLCCQSNIPFTLQSFCQLTSNIAVAKIIWLSVTLKHGVFLLDFFLLFQLCWWHGYVNKSRGVTKFALAVVPLFNIFMQIQSQNMNSREPLVKIMKVLVSKTKRNLHK